MLKNIKNFNRTPLLITQGTWTRRTRMVFTNLSFKFVRVHPDFPCIMIVTTKVT